MQRNIADENTPEVKFSKTGILWGITNGITALLVSDCDPQTKFVIFLAVNAIELGYFHSLGKSRRPGLNFINGVNSFFASHLQMQSYDIDNMIRNIINGGAAVYDEVRDMGQRLNVPHR